MAKNQRGFTQGELLVQWFIFAVLLSLLFPVFAKVREKSRQTSCLNNLKQLGSAFRQYAQDNDTQMPGYVFHSDHASAHTVNGKGWAGPLWPYIKNTKILKCSNSSMTGTASAFPICYALNSNAATLHSKDFASPARTVLLFEVDGVCARVKSLDEGQLNGAAQVSAAGNGVNGLLSSSPGQFAVSQDAARYATDALDNSTSSSSANINQYLPEGARHSGGSNFLLADEHVKWFRPNAVSAGGNASDAKAPQSTTGCSPDGSQHSGSYPCAAGTENASRAPQGVTFSVN